MEITATTRREARDRGETYFITGRPCRRGHYSKRYMNGGQCVECAFKFHNKHDLHKTLFRSARLRAQKCNLPFDIELQDIVVPEFCPVLGIKLERGRTIASDASPSLDKIKPELGYVKGNIAVISHRANTIKSNATAAELRQVAEWLDKS